MFGPAAIAAVVVLGLVPWGLLSAGQRTDTLDVPHIGFLGFRPLTESSAIEVLTALREELVILAVSRAGTTLWTSGRLTTTPTAFPH